MLWSGLTCVLSVLAAVVLAQTALMTRRGQDIDQEAMETVYARQTTLDQVLSLLGYVSIGSAGIALLICVTLALLRQRFAAAIGAVVVVAGANVSTQLVKHAVERPEMGHGMLNSLPSGHVTVVASIVLAALLVAGDAMRVLVAGLGGLAVTLTGASTLVAGWHRPSDVLASLAVALAWGAGVVVVLGLRRPGSFHTVYATQALLALLGAGAAGAILLVLGVRPDGGWPGVTEAATVLGVIGLASAGTVALFARLSSAHAR